MHQEGFTSATTGPDVVPPSWASTDPEQRGNRSRHRAHPQSDAAPVPRGLTGTKAVLVPVVTVLTIGLVFVSVFRRLPHTEGPSPADRGRRLGPGGGTLRREAATDGARRLPGRALSGRGHRQVGRRAPPCVRGLRGHHRLPAPALRGRQRPRGHGHGHSARPRRPWDTGTIQVRDILPLSKGDSRGLSVFYASFGLVLAGFLFGQMTYQLAPRLSFRQRVVSLGSSRWWGASPRRSSRRRSSMRSRAPSSPSWGSSRSWRERWRPERSCSSVSSARRCPTGLDLHAGDGQCHQRRSPCRRPSCRAGSSRWPR